VTQTRGTLLPGLIELHNHMPYDVLSLWQVPRHFDNRDQWSAPSNPDYHRLVTGPMQVLGADPDVVPAIVRYVEVRALLGGTTTGQGIALAKSAIISHFRGLVRNVESTHDPDLKPAATHIADIDSTDADHFLARISGSQKIILHLSEGIDTHAHDAFEALQLANGDWAITDNLIGIHCLALTAADFKTFGKHGGSMVWSPLSNLLLYGQTADVGEALDAGVPVALGSDWAPSGSSRSPRPSLTRRAPTSPRSRSSAWSPPRPPRCSVGTRTWDHSRRASEPTSWSWTDRPATPTNS
jgi:5-methylthioadenosine/S-adenosylhomocysteine deaminase